MHIILWIWKQGGNSVSKSWRLARDVSKEEKRASKEGLKLLKESGELSKEELKNAKARFEAAHRNYVHTGKAGFLQSLSQKTQIPSRRLRGGHYKSTLTDRKLEISIEKALREAEFQTKII